MKSGLILSILASAIAIPSSAQTQQPASTSAAYLQASLAAMVGQSTIQDVTLNGTAEVIAGSSDQTAPAVLEALSGGSSSIAINLPNGVSTDVRLIGAFAPSGTWSNGNGTQNTISQQNLMTDSAWFFPNLVVSRMISSTSMTVVYVGQAGNLLHLQAFVPQPATPTVSGPLLQHLTEMDIYLNSTTFLPVELQFNIHPDGNASIDIPIAIEYSNYQTVSGISLPFHVQKYMNNNLALDIQIQSTAFNSGLTAAALSAQ